MVICIYTVSQCQRIDQNILLELHVYDFPISQASHIEECRKQYFKKISGLWQNASMTSQHNYTILWQERYAKYWYIGRHVHIHPILRK